MLWVVQVRGYDAVVVQVRGYDAVGGTGERLCCGFYS